MTQRASATSARPSAEEEGILDQSMLDLELTKWETLAEPGQNEEQVQQAAAARMDVAKEWADAVEEGDVTEGVTEGVGPARYCSPRHPTTHFELSFIE